MSHYLEVGVSAVVRDFQKLIAYSRANHHISTISELGTHCPMIKSKQDIVSYHNYGSLRI